MFAPKDYPHAVMITAVANRTNKSKKETSHFVFDRTAEVASQLGASQPYLFSDVEVRNRIVIRDWKDGPLFEESLNRQMESIADLRDELSEACKESWFLDALPDLNDVIPFPVPERLTKAHLGITSDALRLDLLTAQKQDYHLGAIITQKRKDLDPYAFSKKKTSKKKGNLLLKPKSQVLRRMSIDSIRWTTSWNTRKCLLNQFYGYLVCRLLGCPMREIA